jgi:protein SCO1/2
VRALIALAVVLAAGAASAQFYGKYEQVPKLNSGRVTSSGAAAGVRVEQKLNEFVPLDLEFKNEDGKTVTMRSLQTGRPTLLLPIFFLCTGICTTELNKLMETLNGMKTKDGWVGEGFDVVVFGIDPTEGPDLAHDKKASYLGLYRPKGYGKLPPNAGANFHFLTGSKENILRFTEEIGFIYRIDPKNGGIVHPAALLVLTPEGQISKYFLGQEYPARILKMAVQDAQKDVIGTRDDAPFFLSCIALDPHSGQITVNVMNTIKTAGIITLIGVIGAIVVWERKGRKNRMTTEGGS